MMGRKLHGNQRREFEDARRKINSEIYILAKGRPVMNLYEQ
jgi:hypothetical protein